MIIDRSSDFYKLSEEITREFLLTAIVVDDRPQTNWGSPDPTKMEKPPSVTGEQSQLLTSKSKIPDDKNGHALEADIIIDKFAEMGIICSIIQPTKDKERFKNTLKNLVVNTDIFILDWELERGDSGDFALEIMDEAIREADEAAQQLRLIVIYTGEDLVDVCERIKENYAGLPNYREIDNNTYNVGPTRIVVFGKYFGREEKTDRLVESADLPDIVIGEFTVMTAGLVPNTVIKALCTLRKNSKKMLANFTGELDYPFLVHRILLDKKDKEAAELLLVNLIVEEIRAILDEASVKGVAGFSSINYWLSQHNISHFDLGLKGTTIPINSKERIITLLEEGLEPLLIEDVKDIENHKKLLREFDRKAHHKHLIKMFGITSNDDADELDQKFALLTSLRSFYSNDSPKLSLGTIVKYTDTDVDKYLICIQPRCDSGRLNKSRLFLFLPLMKKDDGFTIILKDGDEFVKLRPNNNSYELHSADFTPITSGDGFISAEMDPDTGKFYFKDNKKTQYIWVGELRWPQAQSVAQNFSEKLCRVGLDESEWLRRHSQR